MSLFARKLEELIERIESKPEEFSRLVNKHNLENYSGPQDVLFSNIFGQEQKAILLTRNEVTPTKFGVVYSNMNVCVDVDNNFDENEFEFELDLAA